MADEPGTAVALDLSSGSERWSVADRFPQSDFQLTTDEVALVRKSDDGLVSRHLVDVADGTTVADLEPMALEPCVTDGQELIACSVIEPPSRLLSYQVGETQPRTSPQVSGESWLSLAFGGYLFTGTLASGGNLALDCSGNVLSDPLPGAAVRVTDE